MLSSDVTTTKGGGSCQPSAIDCQFLALKDGDQRTITYQVSGGSPHKLSLRLNGIHAVVVDKSNHGADKNTRSAAAPSGIAAWLGLGD
jgi:hypothetical protein